MRKWTSLLMLAVVCVFAAGLGSGCADDVKTVKKSETVHESEPQMVSPGEMIVE